MSTREIRYPLAERFYSVQGEGVYTGVPMAFIRFVGCSVGQKICTHCDTDFDKMYQHLGGGLYTPEELEAWVGSYQHVCFTGGEPLDRNLEPLYNVLFRINREFHVETSGTKPIPEWCRHSNVWICVSPKPGYLEESVLRADEVKVIVNGLGDGPGWPTLQNAVDWARQGKIVYLQPRNGKHDIWAENMASAMDTVLKHPNLRLSAQLHKYLVVR